MTASRTFNVYCDESCHLEHDHMPVMAWGAVSCPTADARPITEAVRALKAQHGLASDFEAKWTKVSPAKADFYLALIDLFLADERLRFRGLLVPDKALIDHARFDQSHDDWYYKMYFTMLRPIFTAPHRYRIYLDVKDTRGGPKTRKLHDVLANSLLDFERQTVERVQQVRSHESELLQISDLLIGALTYANRGLATSPAKAAIIERLRASLGPQALSRTSTFAATKFNILVWRAQEAAEMNPPDLVPFNAFGGDWAAYETELNRIFIAEIARGGLAFRGVRVNCRRVPEAAGRWASFWHLVQEGRVEDDRTPDLRRCERIRWVRWVIENAAAHAEIDEWQNMRGTEANTLLWYREEYLVVLAQRRGYWLLRTAYCTDKSGRIRQLRKERDAFGRAMEGRP